MSDCEALEEAMKELPTYKHSSFREGWIKYDLPCPDGFSEQTGPYLFREPGSIAGVGFIATQSHANYIDLIHGGALMSLADVALWDICRREIESEVLLASTITMNLEFVSSAKIGDFIQASGDLIKRGKNILFVRGLIKNDEKILLSFSGTMKHIG